MYLLKILATRNINFIIYLLARSFLFSLGVQRARNYIDVALCKCTIYAGHYFMPCGPIYIFFIICPPFYESVHVLQLLFIQNFMAFFFFSYTIFIITGNKNSYFFLFWLSFWWKVVNNRFINCPGCANIWQLNNEYLYVI